MTPHWLVVVATAGVAACGSEESSRPAPIASQDAAQAPKSRPVPPAPVTPASDPFEAQVRDPKWADLTERGITQRFARVRGGRLRATECRHDRCRLVIAGTKAQLAQTIADLQGPRGLSGYAASIMLGTPELQADGSVELRAVAKFRR